MRLPRFESLYEIGYYHGFNGRTIQEAFSVAYPHKDLVGDEVLSLNSQLKGSVEIVTGWEDGAGDFIRS